MKLVRRAGVDFNGSVNVLYHTSKETRVVCLYVRSRYISWETDVGADNVSYCNLNLLLGLMCKARGLTSAERCVNLSSYKVMKILLLLDASV